jgi:hypothetical protein
MLISKQLSIKGAYMDVQINLVGVIVAVIASMVVGWLWYSDWLLGKQWRMLEHIDEKRAKKDMPMGMVGMIITSFLMAYVLAHVSYLSFKFFTDNSYQSSALMTAFWMWLGFVLPVVLSNSLFNQRRKKATIIHAAFWLVNILVMGLVIGAIGL